jgi:hypothetical protein
MSIMKEVMSDVKAVIEKKKSRLRPYAEVKRELEEKNKSAIPPDATPQQIADLFYDRFGKVITDRLNALTNGIQSEWLVNASPYTCVDNTQHEVAFVVLHELALAEYPVTCRIDTAAYLIIVPCEHDQQHPESAKFHRDKMVLEWGVDATPEQRMEKVMAFYKERVAK